VLLPGIGVAEDLREVRDIGVTVARVATHCTEADISEQHIGLARELGMEAIGFLMMSHMVEPARLVEQARLMESYGAECVYVADSAGAMTMTDVRARVAALRAALSCDIGFHGHHNLSLATANSLVAIEEGATHIDGCLCGLGAGAGNCPTEILIAACEKLGISSGVDLFRIIDAAEEVVRPMMRREQVIDRTTLLLGYAGVTSSYLLHAQRASAKFGVDPKEIVVELGRRKVVSGQEDMILDVAIALAGGATGG
jgi:4-hydroxy 2-oxovalerate aldolase